MPWAGAACGRHAPVPRVHARTRDGVPGRTASQDKKACRACVGPTSWGGQSRTLASRPPVGGRAPASGGQSHPRVTGSCAAREAPQTFKVCGDSVKSSDRVPTDHRINSKTGAAFRLSPVAGRAAGRQEWTRQADTRSDTHPSGVADMGMSDGLGDEFDSDSKTNGLQPPHWSSPQSTAREE